MEAVLYAARDGALALVPGCFKPCRDMESAHGPFRAYGRIAIDDVPPRALWSRIMADFEHCGYAMLSAAEAASLFGVEGCWGFSDRRATPREVQLSYEQLHQHLVRWSLASSDDAKTNAKTKTNA